MKFVALLGLVASAAAFAPIAQNNRFSTVQYALADRIFGLDLFTPKQDQNNYGARKSENLKVGKITNNSYIPDGLSKA